MAHPQKLLDAVLVTGAGRAFACDRTGRSFQATLVGTGAITATIKIQVSLDQVQWLDQHTITLSGTTSTSDGVASESAWAYTRANCTAISGTGAALTVSMVAE